MFDLPPFEPLNRRERAGIAALLVGSLALGFLVEMRSGFVTTRRTDLSVYLRAAWAIRSDTDLYDATIEGGDHYNYPPLSAILLVPFADPPAGSGEAPAVPFLLSAALWYLAGMLALAAGVHRLAGALEETDPELAMRPPPGSRAWWGLRLLPVMICIPGVVRTAHLGQIDLLVLGMLCAMIASAVRGRSAAAGLWQAGAICIKVLPAFLLLYPLLRRDRCWLAGCAAGLATGLAVVPAVTVGPRRALADAEKWVKVFLLPSLGAGTDTSRLAENTGITTTHSQSPARILHNWQYPDPERRPATVTPGTRRIHWLIGAVMTAVTVWAIAGAPPSGTAVVVSLGCLLMVMLMLAPVCHPHYLVHWLPLIAGLLAAETRRRPGRIGLGGGTVALCAAAVVGGGAISIRGLEPLRDFGLATATGLLLWAAGIRALLGSGRAQAGQTRGTEHSECGPRLHSGRV